MIGRDSINGLQLPSSGAVTTSNSNELSEVAVVNSRNCQAFYSSRAVSAHATDHTYMPPPVYTEVAASNREIFAISCPQDRLPEPPPYTEDYRLYRYENNDVNTYDNTNSVTQRLSSCCHSLPLKASALGIIFVIAVFIVAGLRELLSL